MIIKIFSYIFVDNFFIDSGLQVFHDCSHSNQLIVKAGLGHELHPSAIRTRAMDCARNLARTANCILKKILTCVVTAFTNVLCVRGKCQHNTLLLLSKRGKT